MGVNTDSYHSFFDSMLRQEYGIDTHTIIQAIRTLFKESRERSMPDYMASTKKSRREMLKSKLDAIIDEEDEEDDIKKPMKDMFLDSKRKRRSKTRKANEEKGEDADESHEESEYDDASGSTASEIPEDADDNEDENEFDVSGANDEKGEDADERPTSKRRKDLNKFSVTTRGSQRYDGWENYNQSPMMREVIDRHIETRNLAKDLNKRVSDIEKSRRNKRMSKPPIKMVR